MHKSLLRCPPKTFHHNSYLAILFHTKYLGQGDTIVNSRSIKLASGRMRSPCVAKRKQNAFRYTRPYLNMLLQINISLLCCISTVSNTFYVYISTISFYMLRNGLPSVAIFFVTQRNFY